MKQTLCPNAGQGQSIFWRENSIQIQRCCCANQYKVKRVRARRTRRTRTPAFWDTPYRHMITYSSDSHQTPSQKKRKSKLQIWKIAKNSNFKILQETLHATHLLKLLDKIYKYEMDPARTVGATERTRDVGRTDGRLQWNLLHHCKWRKWWRERDGRMDGVKPIYPPTTLLCGGHNKKTLFKVGV